LMWLLLGCVFTVFAVVGLGSRSFAVGVRVVAPVLLALVLTAAVVRLVLGPLTVFHVVALLLVLGLSTNYALFVHSPTDRTDSRNHQAHTAFSLAMASATTLAVFGALAVSGITVVAAVGQTVAIGIVIALAAIVFAGRPSPGKFISGTS
jgi:predicted exporter